MSTGPQINGPAFWLANFGFTSYAEFKAQAKQFVPDLLPFGDFGIDDQWLSSAYAAPWSGAGLAIQSGFALEGYSGVAKTSGTAVQQLLNQGAAINQGDTSMGTLVIADCFQVSLQAEVAGHVVENVIGLKNASGSAADAAAAVKTAWEQSGGPLELLRTDVVMTNYHAVDIGSPTGAIADLASTTAGSSASGALSTRASCALVAWNGSSRSRSTRGRMYIGPLNGNNLQGDGATLNTTFASDLSDAVQAMRDSLTFLGYPLQVLSRTLSIATPVTAHAVEATCATQRRRLRS